MPAAQLTLTEAIARFRELVAEADRLDTEAARIAAARDAVRVQMEDAYPDAPVGWF